MCQWSISGSCVSKTTLFVKALVGNPSLASYIRRLEYEIPIAPGRSDEDPEETLSAVEMMTQVADLRPRNT